jgi:hypothetical protein
MLRNIDAAAVATAFRPSRGRTCDPAAAQYAGARAGVGIEDAGLSGRDPVLAVTELYAHAAAVMIHSRRLQRRRGTDARRDMLTRMPARR